MAFSIILERKGVLGSVFPDRANDSEKLSTDYNGLLKYTLKQVAETAIQAKDNPFRQKYLSMTALRGMAPHRAKLTISMDMLATMWAVWKKGEHYNPEITKQIKIDVAA
jgi:hypothetical protein